MGAVLAIPRIIREYSVAGFVAFWHHLRHHLLFTKTLIDKPPIYGEAQGMAYNSNAFDTLEWRKPVLDNGWELQGSAYNSNAFDALQWRGSVQGMAHNSNAFDALQWRRPVLDNVMEALGDPNTHIIGVYGSNDEMKDTLLERVWRRINRDKLFDVVLIATVTKKPAVKKIQEEIACQLGFNFQEKSEGRRASELRDKIKNEQKILIILCNLCKGLELDKVGIPFGTDHTGCKILLTSASEDVLSNQMHTQKTFMV